MKCDGQRAILFQEKIHYGMCIKQCLLEGNEEFYYYPNCTLHAILSVKIGCTAHFADESRKENIVCAHGNAGYYVPGKDNCGR